LGASPVKRVIMLPDGVRQQRGSPGEISRPRQDAVERRGCAKLKSLPLLAYSVVHTLHELKPKRHVVKMLPPRRFGDSTLLSPQFTISSSCARLHTRNHSTDYRQRKPIPCNPTTQARTRDIQHLNIMLLDKPNNGIRRVGFRKFRRIEQDKRLFL